jgi:putative acetyltransferase
MFVDPGYRGLGIGRKLLRFVEEEAARRGFTRGVLETGTLQHEAIALYVSAGWEPAPAFGPYVGAVMSTCFAKNLVFGRPAGAWCLG